MNYYICLLYVFLMLSSLSCSESETRHDESIFGGNPPSGDSSVPTNPDYTQIPNPTGCEIASTTEPSKKECALYAGLLLKRLVDDCSNFQGSLIANCSEYTTQSKCVANAGQLGSIILYGSTQEECTQLASDPMTQGATVSFSAGP